MLGAGFKPVGELHSQPFDSAFAAEPFPAGTMEEVAVEAVVAVVVVLSALQLVPEALARLSGEVRGGA